MDLSLGIVAYNALDKLRDCLDSIARQTILERVETIVVDNASTEPVAATVAAAYPWVKLLVSETNLGFAGGTNRAFAAATGERLLWLNPDTVLPEPDTLERLLARFETAGVDVMGCRLELADGSSQPLRVTIPTVAEVLLDAAHLGRRPRLVADEAGPLVPVEYVCGACLLCTRAIWERTGGLDEGYFMYFEDADWCIRVWASSRGCAVATDITVRHLEGAAYGGRVYLRRQHFWTSFVRYVSRHDRRRLALLRLGLVATALPKLPLAALARDARRADRLDLLRTQLRLGLRGR